MDRDTHGEIVRLCVDGEWVAACGDNWGEMETSTACMQLGLGGESILWYKLQRVRHDASHTNALDFGSYTRNGSEVEIPLSLILNCSQAEDSLLECISDEDCKGNHAPRIQCSPSSSKLDIS